MGIVDTGSGRGRGRRVEGGETHFRWVTYRIRMEPNNPTRIGGCEYVCTRLFGMEERYNNNNTAMVPLLSKLMTAGAMRGGGRQHSSRAFACLLSISPSLSSCVCILHKCKARLLPMLLQHGLGSWKFSCTHSQIHTHTLAHTEVDIKSTYCCCCLVFPHWGWRRLAAAAGTKNGNNNNIEVQCSSTHIMFMCAPLLLFLLLLLYGCLDSVYSLLWLCMLYSCCHCGSCCSWCRLLFLLLLLLLLLCC